MDGLISLDDTLQIDNIVHRPMKHETRRYIKPDPSPTLAKLYALESRSIHELRQGLQDSLSIAAEAVVEEDMAVASRAAPAGTAEAR